MSLKTVVVHADDSPRLNQRLDAAIRLARGFDAELVGVYIVSTPELVPSVAALLPPDVVAQRLRETGDAQHRAENLFRQATAAVGLGALDWRAPAGPAIAAAVAHARCSDIVVVGQPKSGDIDPLFDGELVTTVMLSAGRPTLIVPHIGARPTLGENVLIAWDGGREAARAIADALPILVRARQVVITSINEDPDRPAVNAQAQSRLAAYLRRHGVEPQVKQYDGRRADVSEALLSRAADLGTDLIVMGGYGHPRLREMVLGGATRSMLRTMTVPVLMSH
jgi:nucleotide-binding universal stress UspA family protein